MEGGRAGASRGGVRRAVGVAAWEVYPLFGGGKGVAHPRVRAPPVDPRRPPR